MLKVLSALLVIFASGFIGYSLNSPELASTEPQMESQNIQERVIYKECEEKADSKVDENFDLEEAKKYYGRAFQLFLASIGYKLRDKDKAKMTELLENPRDFVITFDDKRERETEVIIPREFDFIASSKFQDFVKKEKAELRHIEDQGLLENAQKFILKEPDIFKARSKYIESYKDVKKFNGDYEGALYIIAGKRKGKTDRMAMKVNFFIKEEDSIDGSFSLKLSDAGEVYSHSRGSGGNGDIRIKDDSIVIDAGPDGFFHFLKDNLNIGNFYSKGKLLGIARLKKI